MILDWLTQDFADLFAHDRRARVALWCDAKADFRNLLPEVSEHFSTRDLVLLAFDTAKNQGALWLKWATEAGPWAGKQVVVWLPYACEDLSGSADDGTRLDCLLEYTYAGLTCLIDGKPPTLFGFLKKHRVPLPSRRADQDPLWRGRPVSPLAKYVRMQLRRDVAFWPSKMLSLAAIEEGLIGDPAERLLRLLADPQDEWEALQQEGNAKGYVEARDPEAFDRAFADMTRAHAGALLVFGDAMVFQHRSRLAELAATSRLPTMHNIRPFVEAGGLMAYEPRPPDLRRRAAVYVDKILKGAKPADLPVEQPMTFELVINLKTAQALGLTIPSALLFQATEIIR